MTWHGDAQRIQSEIASLFEKAGNSQEELQALNAITAKLALPAVSEPKNQAESGPASIVKIASELLKDADGVEVEKE